MMGKLNWFGLSAIALLIFFFFLARILNALQPQHWSHDTAGLSDDGPTKPTAFNLVCTSAPSQTSSAHGITTPFLVVASPYVFMSDSSWIPSILALAALPSSLSIHTNLWQPMVTPFFTSMPPSMAAYTIKKSPFRHTYSNLLMTCTPHTVAGRGWSSTSATSATSATSSCAHSRVPAGISMAMDLMRRTALCSLTIMSS